MSDYLINSEWMANPTGEWRIVRARARAYEEGCRLVLMQVPQRTDPAAEPNMLGFPPPSPEATIGGCLYTLMMAGLEVNRGNNGEYTVAAQVWTTADREEGGLVGCGFEFHPNVIIITLPLGILELDIMLVVGYGLTSDLPESRIISAPLFRRV